MGIVAAEIYWVIVALWLAVLGTVCFSYLRNPRTFGATRLLLIVVGIDTLRNIVENLYFGLYFGAQFGLFPGAIAGVLGKPYLLIIPKLINVFAAFVVISLLFRRWLPIALKERSNAEDEVRQKTESLIQETEENQRLFETSVDLIVVTDRERVVTRISHSCISILGYEPGEIIGRYGGEFVCPSDLETLRSELTLSMSGNVIRNFRTGLVHKDGHVVMLAWTGVWSEQAQRFFLIVRDTTEQNAAESRLLHLAHFDQLTGLPNRTSLLMDLEQLSQKGAGKLSSTSLVMFDLDRFKDINDSLGHLIGDRVLQQVAARLAELPAETGRCYRLGGDEFVLLLRACTDPLIITKVVEATIQRIEVPVEIQGRRLFVGASAGIAITPADGWQADDLIANADLALYDAKDSGGRRYRMFVSAMRAKAHARQEMDAELRRACSQQEFILYFQPQIRLSDGAIVGAEALLRWQHPVRGLLAPAAFIEALVESPTALAVGRWILRSSCEYAASWRRKGLTPVRVGVNLFPVQFQDGMLHESVREVLHETGLPAAALELEITENIALGQEEVILTSLRALRTMGVGLAFDDFGTGYASLSCLTRYPLTRIKIDRSFVQKMGKSSTAQDTAVVSSIIVMAHNLGLDVTAEGVETIDQAAFLAAKGCDEVQGFLFAKPLPVTEFEQFLRNGMRPIPADRHSAAPSKYQLNGRGR